MPSDSGSTSQWAVGKSKAELRPLKENSRPEQGEPTFPVYADLENHLAKASPGRPEPDPVARHVCSVLAGWAYSDAQTVADIMTRLGLVESRCRSFSVSNNSMFIRSTAYLVQSKSGRVALLAYRGTDPFDLSTWAADYDVNPTAIKVPQEGRPSRAGSVIHAGFYRNQRATWFDIATGLKNALENKSILAAANAPGELELEPLEALYITGHSLGAAMAGVAAFRIATDPQYKSTIWPKVRATYSFAQPMIGNQALKDTCELVPDFVDKYFVHLYEDDIVPHLPPTITGEFAHFGRMFRSARSSSEKRTQSAYEWVERTEPVKPVESLAALAAAAVALFGKQIVRPRAAPAHAAPSPKKPWLVGLAREIVNPFVDVLRARVPTQFSFYDHSAANYIACSQLPNVLTEFGDF